MGDLRQRIRFKQSEDTFFDQTFELLSDDHPAQEHDLSKNFRSVQEILNFANALLRVIAVVRKWRHADRGE